MTIFGCLGLILVTVGVYSVLAYTTARKTHEIGIRMALGAERTDVLRLVIRTGLRLVTAGAAIGLIVSLLLGRVIEAELWRGLKPYDPATLASTTLLLAGTGAFSVLDSGEKSSASGPDGGPAL
jgi:putative ABC transport system permease protein